jgi:HAD superfamily hydrolase (TIGR01509 family)
LRATPHIPDALTWLRGPNCVASSSTHDRIRVSLETTGLLRFFEHSVFSASEVPRGKPAPDLLLYAAAKMGVQASDCIVVEDSAPGIAAARAAGMMPIGYVSNVDDASMGANLMAAGARTLIADMRQLKSTVVALRGW